MTSCQAHTVALIGCGPAGMFLLHALATRRRMMEAKGDTDGLARLPDITCFERASGPGGVWRADRQDATQAELEMQSTVSEPEKDINDVVNGDEFGEDDEENVAKVGTGNMYEALWTNGPKEAIEFFDYSYDDHFGQALPVYMPRQPLLEYMISRVTRHNSSFFDGVNFNTTVVHVSYNDDKKKFEVVTEDRQRNTRTTAEFDKCVWAAGENGKPYIPSTVHNLLTREGFKGKTIHSSNIGDFRADTCGKRILLIGDSLSAEDLALQAIKLGVEKVYIYSRSGNGITLNMGSWPMNKVEIICNLMPTGVVQDGNGIRFTECTFDIDEWRHEQVKGGKVVDFLNLSTVVYCTGYCSNMTMLDRSLKHQYTDYREHSLKDIPKDWKMTLNVLTDDLGNVPPADEIESCRWSTNVGIYRGLLISNPNMMFLTQFSEIPLFEIDVNAWVALAHITGDMKIPSVDEMNHWNTQVILDQMQQPSIRYLIDANYRKAMIVLSEDDPEHWIDEVKDPRYQSLFLQDFLSFEMRNLARDMCDACYPTSLGSYNKLNNMGEALVQILMNCANARYYLDPDSLDSSWRTFRDCDPSRNFSLYTGTRAVSLGKHWLDLEDTDMCFLSKPTLQQRRI